MHYVHAVVGGTAGWGSGISSISVCDSGLEEAVPGRVLLWSGQARQQQQQLASLVPPSPASLGLGWEHCQPATQSPAFVVPQMHNWRSGSLNYYLKCITAHARTHTGCNIMHKRSVHDVRVVLYWVILWIETTNQAKQKEMQDFSWSHHIQELTRSVTHANYFLCADFYNHKKVFCKCFSTVQVDTLWFKKNKK